MKERVDKILEKARRLIAERRSFAPEAVASFNADFDLTFVHNSTAIEGNTLTLLEVKTVFEDRIAVGGKSLREIYEVANHRDVLRYMRECLADRKPLDEEIVKEIHARLTANILVGGVYRHESVRISGAGFKPPDGHDMYVQIKNFYCDFAEKRSTLDPISYAAWTHAEFVRIHPFVDGNGRTARCLMNYQLMDQGLLPVSVAKENRLRYYEALEEYAVRCNLDPFALFVADLEESHLAELPISSSL